MPLPPRQGLYDPAFEHDACGLGFVATLKRQATHQVVSQALEILQNLTHRGAAGCDPCTGDGAGILLQIPHATYAAEVERERKPYRLPEPGDYGVAMVFLSQVPAKRREHEALLEAAVLHHGQTVIGWRDVPLDMSALGELGRSSCPSIRMLFIGRQCPKERFEQILFMIRKRAGRTADDEEFYIVSCSALTVVYKGLMLAEQVSAFFPDLYAETTASRLAMVHSRFSTNTFPTWSLAHPFRRIAHNGEINTLRGNRAWMAARESLLQSDLWGDALEDFLPIIRPGGSDSAALDNVVDFLVASGRSLPHVMMMLVPEAWEKDPSMSEEERAFYEFHANLVEPWDGPAALCYTDGELIGATLDRNGLRPAKYVVTSDGLVVLASELGVLRLDPSRVIHKGRLQPGKMFLVDTVKGSVISDEEIKAQVVHRQPYKEWLEERKVDLATLPKAAAKPTPDAASLGQQQRLFGYTKEDLRQILEPMGRNGEEPMGSMGVDIPLAVLSEKPQNLFRYFKQHFAQVTNPPIDPIREDIVMSLVICIGGVVNLLDESKEQCRLLELSHPILTKENLATLVEHSPDDFPVATLSMLFDATGDPEECLRRGLAELLASARGALARGAKVLVLSDRGASATRAPIPSLLAVGAIHHGLIRSGDRGKAGLVIETAEAREVAHFALLVGYGAGAICPYLAEDSLRDSAAKGLLGEIDGDQAFAHFTKAVKKGLLKVMSKMGISTLQSYLGAQIFEAVGIDQIVIDEHFTGTASRLRGDGLREIADASLARHHTAFHEPSGPMDVGGHLQFRVTGENHLWNPESVASLQKAVRLSDNASYERYAASINEQTAQPSTIRGLWDLRVGKGIPVEEVEPAAAIVKRFATGAMSFGSISKEAHENLAVAMNRIGGRSNTGEGGEEASRFLPDAAGDSRRSAIKQVASARFGVTAHYLVNADEIQIKMAQGAKPGEGGQLPGHKVDAVIGRVRHSLPGVTLISPPPHHDIYSIEDLAELIFDLRNVNPRASISVKLVAEAGIGTIAAGVAKAQADCILISGHDGGTGASPLTSIHHAGLPWELGLAEAQQVLLMNGLRDRVRIQVDGQLKTGLDVVFGALLGAEEFGFSTAPLVASGCIMMRKCHLNTCPVGIATQDPVLRKKFVGTPEHVINYFFFVAEEVRRWMARLGVRTLDEMVGRSDYIVPRRDGLTGSARRLDYSEILYRPREAFTGATRCTAPQAHNLSGVMDHELIARSKESLETKAKTRIAMSLRNKDRAFGAMLSGEIARRHGSEGLPDDTIVVDTQGSAGQSFGAFAAHGLTLNITGDANDYVGKGLSGGVLALRPPPSSPFRPEDEVIAGNTVLYGATSGRAFFNGQAGERFAVRNSGAQAVVEGIGDHGCEYMTGGVVIVLGNTGRNFGAGMSGGVAYVLDAENKLPSQCHVEVRDDVTPIDENDRPLIVALLEEHVKRTGSPKAAELLAGFHDEALAEPPFVKLVPREYQRALAAQLAEAADPNPTGQGASALDEHQKRTLSVLSRTVAHG
jgi:glutamate synthase (NADPH) large chain